MFATQPSTRKELRAEMKALKISGRGASMPTMIVGLIACMNTAATIATLVYL